MINNEYDVRYKKSERSLDPERLREEGRRQGRGLQAWFCYGYRSYLLTVGGIKVGWSAFFAWWSCSVDFKRQRGIYTAPDGTITTSYYYSRSSSVP